MIINEGDGDQSNPCLSLDQNGEEEENKEKTEIYKKYSALCKAVEHLVLTRSEDALDIVKIDLQDLTNAILSSENGEKFSELLEKTFEIQSCLENYESRALRNAPARSVSQEVVREEFHHLHEALKRSNGDQSFLPELIQKAEYLLNLITHNSLQNVLQLTCYRLQQFLSSPEEYQMALLPESPVTFPDAGALVEPPQTNDTPVASGPILDDELPFFLAGYLDG